MKSTLKIWINNKNNYFQTIQILREYFSIEIANEIYNKALFHHVDLNINFMNLEEKEKFIRKLKELNNIVIEIKNDNTTNI